MLSNLVMCQQDYKQTIEAEFTDYLNTIVNMEFEKSVEYIVPEFFDVVPKSQVIMMMQQGVKSKLMETEILNPQILKIDNAVKIDGKYYVLLTYSSEMKIRFFGIEDETKYEKSSRLSMTKGYLEDTFGSDNVYYNDEKDRFDIQSVKDVYAISENGQDNWRFLVIEKDQKMIIDHVLPTEISEKL